MQLPAVETAWGILPFLIARKMPRGSRPKRAGDWGSLQLASERLASRRAGQAGLEAENRLRVQLRDARLGHAEHLADLAQGQLLVVVERDDQLLALGQPRDRLAERLLQLRLRQLGLRLRALGVLDRVDQGDLVAAGGGDRPELVEGGDRGAPDLGEALVELVGGDAELLGEIGRA